MEDDWRDEMGFDDDVETLIPHMHRDDSYGRESVDEQPQVGAFHQIDNLIIFYYKIH